MATKRLKCPNCNTSGTMTIDSIVRVSRNLDAKAHILCGEYFEWECPQCGKRYLFDDVFLYYDDTKGFMVYYVPGFKNNSLPVPTLIRTKDGFDWRDSTLRVTARFLDLAEKIRIFDAGLDDRVIEAVKFFCYVNYENAKQPVRDILFEELGDDDTLFFSVYQDTDCIGLPVPMNAYTQTQSNLSGLFNAPPEDVFILVDQQWLTGMLGSGDDA